MSLFCLVKKLPLGYFVSMQKLMFAAVLASALALMSCGGGTTPTNSGNTGGGSGGSGSSSLTSLSGKVYQAEMSASPVKAVAWPAGQKPAALEVLTSYSPFTTKVISTGTVSAAGELNIALPATDIPTFPISDYQPVLPTPTSFVVTCTGKVSVGDTNVKAVAGTLKVGNAPLMGITDTALLSNLYPEGKASSVSLIYADGATSLTGSFTCQTSYQGSVLSTSTINMNSHLKKGWNVLNYEATMPDSKTTTVTVSTLDSAPQNWVVIGTP